MRAPPAHVPERAPKPDLAEALNRLQAAVTTPRPPRPPCGRPAPFRRDVDG
jgi:hypothetical protein